MFDEGDRTGGMPFTRILISFVTVSPSRALLVSVVTYGEVVENVSVNSAHNGKNVV